MAKISLVVEKLARKTQPSSITVKKIHKSKSRYPGNKRASFLRRKGSRYFFSFLNMENIVPPKIPVLYPVRVCYKW